VFANKKSLRKNSTLYISKIEQKFFCVLTKLLSPLRQSLHFPFHSIYLKISPQGTIDTRSKQHIKTQKNTDIKEMGENLSQCPFMSHGCFFLTVTNFDAIFLYVVT